MGNNVDTIGSNKSGKNSGSVFVVDPNPPGMESIPPEDMFKIKIPEIKIPGFGKIGGKIVDFNPFPESVYKFGEKDLTGGGVSSVSSVPSTTGTAVQNSGFKSFGPPNMQILDQSSRSGDTINQSSAIVGNITNAHDSMDPLLT